METDIERKNKGKGDSEEDEVKEMKGEWCVVLAKECVVSIAVCFRGGK